MREWNGRKIYTKNEQLQFYSDIRNYDKMRLAPGVKRLGALLLDCSLIFASPKQIYTHKVVQCGDYYQVYDFKKKTTKKNSNLEKVNFRNRKKKKSRGDHFKDKENFLYKNDGFLNWSKFKTSRDPPEWLHLNEQIEIIKEKEEKVILNKNIQRSRIELQRLVKSNESIFKTFITLTIAEKLDIEEANKKFASWRTQVQSVLKAQKKEFSYVCVPEYQKRGAIHYHLLTNLDIKENSDIIIPQTEFTEKQMLEMTEEERNNCYDLKYWKNGFVRVDNLKDIKSVVGYISKYMTKNIDNRLWGKRRYLASHNLKVPSTLFLDCEDDRGFLQLLDIQNQCNLNYNSMYATPLGEVVEFNEYKKKEVDSYV